MQEKSQRTNLQQQLRKKERRDEGELAQLRQEIEEVSG